MFITLAIIAFATLIKLVEIESRDEERKRQHELEKLRLQNQPDPRHLKSEAPRALPPEPPGEWVEDNGQQFWKSY